MSILIWLAIILLALRVGRLINRLVFALTHQYSELLHWCVVIGVGCGLAQLATLYAGNILALCLIGGGIEIALLFQYRLLDRLVARRLPAPQESEDEEDNDEDDDEEDYDPEEDEDFLEADLIVQRLSPLIEDDGWDEADLLIEELMDEKLPELLRLRHDLKLDIMEVERRLNQVSPQSERFGTLSQNRDRLQHLFHQVHDRVTSSKAALETLLVIARERQVNDAPDATNRATSLLINTQQENDLLLQTRREIESLSRS